MKLVNSVLIAVVASYTVLNCKIDRLVIYRRKIAILR